MPTPAATHPSRLRKDVADNGSELVPLLDSLKDVRALQYDVDMLTQKVKRYERQAAAMGLEQQSGRKPSAAAGGVRRALGSEERDEAAVGSGGHVGAALPLQAAAQQQSGRPVAPAVQPAAEGGRKAAVSAAGVPAGAGYAVVDKENMGVVPRRSARQA